MIEMANGKMGETGEMEIGDEKERAVTSYYLISSKAQQAMLLLAFPQSVACFPAFSALPRVFSIPGHLALCISFDEKMSKFKRVSSMDDEDGRGGKKV